MKHMKRTIALILSVLLLISGTLNAFAENDTAKPADHADGVAASVPSAEDATPAPANAEEEKPIFSAASQICAECGGKANQHIEGCSKLVSEEPEACTECGEVEKHLQTCSKYVPEAPEACAECGEVEKHLQTCSKYVPETPEACAACGFTYGHRTDCPNYQAGIVADEDTDYSADKGKYAKLNEADKFPTFDVTYEEPTSFSDLVAADKDAFADVVFEIIEVKVLEETYDATTMKALWYKVNIVEGEVKGDDAEKYANDFWILQNYLDENAYPENILTLMDPPAEEPEDPEDPEDPEEPEVPEAVAVITIEGIEASATQLSYDDSSAGGTKTLSVQTNLKGELTYSWQARKNGAANGEWGALGSKATFDLSRKTLTPSGNYYWSTDNYTAQVRVVVSNGKQEATAELTVVIREQKIIASVPGGSISVTGKALPEGATLSATVPAINGETLPGVFDIKVMVDGEEWQPDSGESVTLSIPVADIADGKVVNVYHVIDHAEAITENAKILNISDAPASVKSMFSKAIAACGGNDCVAVETQQNVVVQNGSISVQGNSFSIYVYNEATNEFTLSAEQSGTVTLANITGGNKNHYYYATVGSKFFIRPQLLGIGSYSLDSDQSEGVIVEDSWVGINGVSADVTLEDVAVGDTVIIKYDGALSRNDFWVYITIVREINITYNANGKTATGMPDPLSEVIATDGKIAITLPATPSAANCKFKGWSTNNAGTGTLYEPGATYIPLQDTVFYAIWEEDTYNVSFDPNGGSGEITTQVIEHGKTVTFPEPPVRENYTFLGWCATKDGSTTRYQAGDSVAVYSAATYYAVWGTDLTFTLSGNIAETKMMEVTEFEWKDVTGFSQAGNSYNKEDVEGFYKGTTFRIKAAGDSNFNASNAYSSTGADVKFWTEDNGKTLFVQLPEGVTVDTTITITTEKDKFTVSYVPNGGTPVAPDEGVSSGSSIDPNNKTTTREGYSFDGWYSDAALTQKVTGPVTITAHTTFYAKWSADDYTITYDLNGGTLANGLSNPAKYNTETDDFTLNNPEKLGHTFAGWTGTGLTEPTMDVTVAKGSTGNRAYTATWTENETTLSYVAVGPANATGFGIVTSESEEIPVVTGIPEGSTAQPSSGYIFKGWYADEECTELIGKDESFVPTKANDAIWEEKTYYARFDYGYTDLKISTNSTNAGQSFIVTIRNNGETVTGETIELQIALQGGETVTVQHLPFGTYQVTLDSGWSWRYGDDTENVTLSPEADNQVTLNPAAVNVFWLSGDCFKENQFSLNR